MTKRTRVFTKSEPTQVINLLYIRAAIEANCGVRLPLEQIRKLLVEEGIITPAQAKEHAEPFRGYGEFYEFEDYTTSSQELPMTPREDNS